MTDNIFGNRFHSNREPAWHGLGTVFNDAPLATEAVKRAGLDYEVKTFPVTTEAYGHVMQTDRVAIVRQPVPDDNEPRVFGYASPNYQVIQNMEIAEILDRLTQGVREPHKKSVAGWPVETVGALGLGETIFITLDAGEGDVGGENIRNFFLVSDSKTGGSSLRIAFTPVRVVCQNTLICGLSAATINAAISHRKNLHQEIEFHIDLLSQMRRSQQEVLAAMRKLAATNIAEAQAREIIEAAWPAPKPSNKARLHADLGDMVEVIGDDRVKGLVKATERYEYYTGRVQAFRDGAWKLYEQFNDEHTPVASTAWAAYNAVVECSDYRNGTTNRDGEKSIAASTLFGSRSQEKTRAFSAAMAVADRVN